jgi:hypothetical protein
MCSHHAAVPRTAVPNDAAVIQLGCGAGVGCSCYRARLTSSLICQVGIAGMAEWQVVAEMRWEQWERRDKRERPLVVARWATGPYCTMSKKLENRMEGCCAQARLEGVGARRNCGVFDCGIVFAK